MTDLYQALWQLLRRTGQPVYLAGQVPDGAPFPYLTMLVRGSGALEPGTLEVTAWHRGPDANAQALRGLDALVALLESRGTAVRFTGGLATLFPADPFFELVGDADAVGARARFTLRCIVKGLN